MSVYFILIKIVLIFFAGWGAHHSNYPIPYLTAAAALGMKRNDIDLFVHRLDKVLSKLKGRSAPPTPTSVEEISVVIFFYFTQIPPSTPFSPFFLYFIQIFFEFYFISFLFFK